MHFSALSLLLISAAGMATGLLGAMLGTGGGVFLIPVLVIGFEVPMHYAVATSIVSVIATSSAVASTNVERGVVNMRLGMTLELATVLGAIAGGATAGWLPARALELLFAAMLLPTSVLMWRGRTETPARGVADQAASKPDGDHENAVASGCETTDATHQASSEAAGVGVLGAAFYDEGEQRRVVYGVERLGAGLGISFLAGSLSGLLGIGGGTFKVPALHLVCGVPIKAAAATSNFMIGVTAAASAFLFYGRGEVHPSLASASVVGVLAGSALGVTINRRVRGRLIQRLFAVLLVAVAVQMTIRAWAP